MPYAGKVKRWRGGWKCGFPIVDLPIVKTSAAPSPELLRAQETPAAGIA